jgi:hypothetical protein
MKDAIHRGKRVYAVWLPPTVPSPFFTRYCTRWFRDEAQLFAYFHATGIGMHPPSAVEALDALPGEAGEAASAVTA